MLKKLILEDFGKFDYKEIDLDRNITVIYGKNEAGKSTILDGIEYALFGKTRSERKYNGKATLSFSYRGKDLSVSNGKINGYPLYTTVKEFKELPLWLFESLFFMRTKELPIIEKQGNKTFVSMIEKKLWGEANFDIIVERFKHLLGSYLNRFGENFKKKGELIEEWEEAQKKKENTLKMIENAKRLKEVEIEYQTCLKDREKWDNELKHLSDLRKKEEYEKKIAILRKIREEEREIALLEAELENYRKIEEDLKNIQKLRKEEEEIRKNIEINEVEQKQTQERKEYINVIQKRRTRDTILLFMGAALSCVLFFLKSKLFLISGLILFLGAIYTLFNTKIHKQIQNYKQRLSELNDENRRLRLEMNESKKRIEDILSKNKVKTIMELEILGKRAKKIEDEIRLCKERLKIWRKDAPLEEQTIMANLEKMEKLTGKYDEERFLELSEKLRDIQQKMEKNRQKKGELSHSLENKNESEILKQLKIIEEEIKDIEDKIEALGIAYKILKDIQRETGEKIKYIVEKEAAPIFSSITKNRYSMLRYNEQMKNIEATGEKTLPASQLSDGTRDQLYLSLRIAFVRSILKDEAFFIMDEPFLTSDDDRRRRIIDTLFKFDHCQFIISTKDKDTYLDFINRKAKGVHIL